ncbi:MAG: hypothetical protein FH749_01060 [Firmicutes bacterium]|nr:hypothetical protein [Bacillota bacterium]
MITLLGLAFLGGVMRKTMRISRLKLYIIAICFALLLIGFDTSLTAARTANWLGAAGFVGSILVLIFTRRTSARLLTVMLLSMSLIAFTTGIINWRNQTGQAIDHHVIQIDDHSTGELRLFTYHIVVNEPADQDRLLAVASGLTQQAEAAQHAARFYFYDYPEFYELEAPFGFAEYGPSGYWNRAAHWETEPGEFSWNSGNIDWAQQLSQTEAAIVKTWHDLHQEYTATMGNQTNTASISDEVAERFAVNSTAVEAALIRFENWTAATDE